MENGSATLPSVWLSCRTLVASREFIGFVGLLGASTRSKGFDGMSPSLRALMKAVFSSTWVWETVLPPYPSCTMSRSNSWICLAVTCPTGVLPSSVPSRCFAYQR